MMTAAADTRFWLISFWLILSAAVVLIAGCAWLWSQTRTRNRLQPRIDALQQAATAAEAERARLHAECQHLQQEATHTQALLHQCQQALQHSQTQQQQGQTRLASAEQALQHWQAQQHDWQQLAEEHRQLQQQHTELQLTHERLHTLLQQERVAQTEKLALLTEAGDRLRHQFQTLANDILEDKSRRFSEQNRLQIDTLLKPLHERMQGFGQLIQQTYEKESKQRHSLEIELQRLQQLNTQLHGDARALTEALTGSRNKSQGNWGEMILEKVLETSGLTKGREYRVQAAATQTDEHGQLRRLQPDVLINLPDNKQIIIDAKVSLTAYVRYTRAEDPATAERELAAHVQSVRNHIRDLSAKQYHDIEGLNSLDFVFLFIPVEPAYLLALQHDAQLFDDCFAKRIMLVGPSTLLATLRTVANLWRNEQQNQNALAIAAEGGRLYDKFVGFVTTLEGVGKNIDQAQSQYQQAMKQLSSGTGNLVRRAEKLRLLGVKAGKALPEHYLHTGSDDGEDTPRLPENHDTTQESTT